MVVGRLTFESPRADERIFSEAVTKYWGIPAISSPPWIPTKEESWDLTRRLKRPVPDPHFTMFGALHQRLLANGRPDGLTGLGGDQVFVSMAIGSRVVSALGLRRWRTLRQLLGPDTLRRGSVWSGVLRPTLRHLAPWKGDRLGGWVSPKAAKGVDLPRLLRRHADVVTGIPAIDQRIFHLSAGYSAFGLETSAVVNDWFGRRRSHPFFDPRLIEGTYGFDPWWPARGGHSRALQVEAYGDRLPPSIARRRSKVEFSEVFWPQVLDDATLESVRTGPLRDLGWLEREGFDDLVANAREGMANAAIPLSRCMSLDRWLRSR